MRRLTLLLLAALCVVTRGSILVAQSPPLTPFRGLIDHVSADQWGGVPNANAELWHRAISGDGRYVVFNTPADLNANDNDYNGLDDIFLRDRSTGTTTRISMASDGGPANGISTYGTISADGRHVAFASGASNLVPGDTNSHWDVFVRDLDQQRTVRISELGGIPGDRDSYYPAISADGRFVAFLSSASTFDPGVSPSSPRQLYLKDRDSDGNGIFDEPGFDNMELISVGLTGGIADASVDTPHVSSDGRYVLFESSATNLTSIGNSNGQNHLYRRDRQTGQTEMIDRAVTGGPSSWGVGWGTSDMTDDGRFITFSSISPDIVWFDMNWQSQVFLYDTAAGPMGTTIVSRLPDGTVGNGSSYASGVSADGRYVLFTTGASNLASPPPGASGPAMLAVRDMLDGTFARVDVLDSGEAFDQSDYYYTAAISADGTAIALQSRSQQAVGGIYTFGASHVFVMTALSVTPESASFSMAGGSGAIEVNTSAVRGWAPVTYDSWITLVGDSGFGAGPRTVQYEVSDNPAGIVRNGSIRIGSKVIAIHQEGDGDTTPPVITPIVTGTQVNGWYTSDITVSFEVSDPDSEIVDQSYNCTQTLTFTTDFVYAAPACEATSHGGTATVTVPLRRDTTPPAISIVRPQAAYYAFGTSMMPAYSCDDASGTATCDGPYQGSPFDTLTRGHNVFTVTSTDAAGNTATKSVEYIVGYDQCISLPSAPANLKRWYPFNGNYRDGITGQDAFDNMSAGTFQPGVAGQAWDNWSAWNFLWAGDAPSVLAGPSGLTVAMWVKPRGSLWPMPIPQYQSLVFNPMQYQIVRWLDGTLRWRFNTTAGFDWVNTGVPLWTGGWYHVAVTYNDGLVQTYVNGSLVHSQALSGTLISGPYTAGLQLAGQNGLSRALNGNLDDVMIFDTALPASDIDNLALSGSGSLCAAFASNLTLTVPPTVTANGYYFPVTALLTDAEGRPLPNRPLTITSAISPPQFVEHVTTNASGVALATFPASSDTTGGVHENAIVATFDGDDAFVAASAQSDLTVIGTPPLSWLQPSNITYGTPLGPDQLRATSTLPGTYVYSPAAGTVLDAGNYILTVTFTPDSEYYAPRTLQTMLLVLKATPTIEISSAPASYTGQPQQAAVTVHGAGGVALTPFTVLYNGSPTAPTNAGTYPISVQFAGNSNYNATSASGSFVIGKAAPTVTAVGGTFTYDKQPHAGSGSAIGVLGEALTPVTVTYDGSSPTAPTNAGNHTVRASYAGSANYLAGQSADAALTINRATPTVEISSAPVWYTGSARTATVVVHGVGTDELNPFTVLYDGSAAAPVNAGTYALQVQYAGSENYAPVTATGSFVVNKATPIIGTLNDITETYDGQPHGVNVNIAGVAGEWLTPVIMTYNGSTSSPVNAGVYLAEVRYDGSTNYNPISRTYTLTILKAQPYLQWANPASITYGTALGASQLNPSSNVPGTFAFSPAAGTVLNAGSHALAATFTPADAANYETGAINRPLTVTKANPQVVWYRPADVAYGTALGATQLNATANTAGTFVYTPAAGTVLAAGDHTLSVTFTPDDAANYNGGSALAPFTVLKAATTVTWSNPAGIVYGTALGGSQLNATANVAGTFTYSPAAGAVLNAGSQGLSVTFTPDDAANYNGSSATVSLQVSKAASTVNWSNPAGIVYGTALGATQLNATANVAGTFTYSPAAGAVLNAGSQSLSVTFTPDDAANYNGSSATVSLQVSKAASTVNWSNPAGIVYGTALGATQLNATANVAGTLAYSPAAGAVLNAGSQTLSVTFTPDDAANYNGSSANVSLQVGKAESTLSWSNPAGIAYGTALDATQLNATANVAGTFSYSPAAGAVLNAGAQTLAVTFTPDDAANYNGSSATVSLQVSKAASTVNWSNPAGIVYGTALGATQLNATANVAGTFTYSPAAGTVLNAGSQTLSVTFTPDDAANYNGSSANVSLQVGKAESTLSWSNPAGIVYGTALGATQLNATANVAGTFSYSPAAGAVLNAGSQTLSVTFTPDDAANYNGSSANVSLTVDKAASAISWSDPADIVYGTALGVAQLNATANVAGTFSYSPAAGTVPAAGSYTLSVTFAPADGANYNGSSTTRPLTVVRKALTVTANNASKVFGAPLPLFGASGSGFVNGDSMASLSGTLGFTTPATASSAAGNYPITPSGLSSPNYTISFANGTLIIVPASTATAVTASPDPDGLNQAVTLTAAVSVVSPGAGMPTDIVQFFDGATLLGSATIAGGSASLTTNGLTAGSHSISATYVGDGNFAPSSGSDSLTVATAAQSSTIALTTSPNPANTGQSVTFTATVTAPAGLSGSVAFYDGSTLIATQALSGTKATFSTTALANGGHAISARYLGNATIPPSTSTALAQYVKPSGTTTRTSTTTVTASPSPATLGGNVTLTATVTGSNNRVPTGEVLFMVNGTVIGQGTVSPIGGLQASATFSTSSLARGTHKVQAVYLGDTVVRASAAAQIALVVN